MIFAINSSYESQTVESTADNLYKSLNGEDPTLVIVIGVLGGLMILALVGMGSYVVYAKHKRKNKYREVRLSTQSSI